MQEVWLFVNEKGPMEYLLSSATNYHHFVKRVADQFDGFVVELITMEGNGSNLTISSETQWSSALKKHVGKILHLCAVIQPSILRYGSIRFDKRCSVRTSNVTSSTYIADTTTDTAQASDTGNDFSFVLHGKLGEGASAAVYLGTLNDGREVAVKQFIVNKNSALSIANEVRLMAKFVHLNLVRYVGCEFDSMTRSLYLIMEYVPGGTLKEFIEKIGDCLPHSVCILYMRQLLHGLKYLHDRKILHRDVKANNILLSPNKDVLKLADFGCSKHLSVANNLSIVGTPHWMAPELILTDVYNDKADIWSAGCTLVEMLTGSPPWPSFVSTFQTMGYIANFKESMPPLLPKYQPPQLEKFFYACFQRDPALRSSASELLNQPWLT